MVIICFIHGVQYGQGIEVDNTSFSSQDLAELLLNDGCLEISNASRSSAAAVAYFNANGSDFPLEEGVIIRSGRAAYSAGPYTGENLSSQLNSNSDSFLMDINNADGQSTNITDVAYFEFDFVPLSDKFEFNFLFASNEYGEWQCLSSDVFAFIVTNLDTGEAQNLAVIPGTSTPVSVKNIRDQAFNSGCNSMNSGFFDTYNVDDPENSSVNMRGFTKVMTAKSDMVPGDNYRIRLVIGDSNDAKYDSAVFLEAASFDASFNLGEDQYICSGDEVELSTGLSVAEYSHVWKKDSQIISESSSSIMVTEPGTYEVMIQKINGNCELTDSVVFHELFIEPPKDLSVCDSGLEENFYDLTENNTTTLGIDSDIYEVVYYSSWEDAENNNPIPDDQIGNYQAAENQEIFLKILNTENENFCDALYSFSLKVDDEIIAAEPDGIGVCFSSSGYEIDLTQVEESILNGQDADQLELTYYDLFFEDNVLSAPILTPDSYSLSSGFESKTIWVRLSDVNNSQCFDLVNFEVFENPEVLVSEIVDVIECEYFELPEIEHGNYFTESEGEGIALFPGDIIEEEGTYYIFNVDEETGCFKESSFSVTLINKFDISGTYCGEFVLPNPPAGQFYTAPEGPFGEGEVIPPGTLITSTANIFYYAEVDGELCRDDLMEVIIHPIPAVDQPQDVIVCDSYKLPILGGGNYYTQPNGGGQQLLAGDLITASKTIYIFRDDGVCSNEASFKVNIVPEFEDLEACGRYVLPPLEVGGYYTQPKGQGEQIPEGTIINSSQKIYYYTQTTSSPNCTNYRSFYITIKPIPEVDNLEDVNLCEGGYFVLPELENGEYFTKTNRGGDLLMPGEVIEEDQKIYINNVLDGCQNETNFNIKFFEYPPISNFTDIYTCEPYVVPEPAHGQIFTEPGGQGSMIYPGQELYTSQTLYVYNKLEEEPFCESEQMFTVYVNYVNLGSFADVKSCDFYVLPELQEGDYYTQPGAGGEMLFANDTIFETQTIYVYAEKGERFVCTDERSFEVVISETPVLPEFDDVVICGSYQLPELNDESFEDWEIGYYREPNGQQKIDPEDYNFKPGEYSIYVRAQAVNNPDCFDEKQFDLIINPLLEMHIDDQVICIIEGTNEVIEPAILESGINPEFYTIEWYDEEGDLLHTGENFEVYEAGEYTVIANKIGQNNGDHCDYEPFVVQVRESSKPLAVAWTISEDFEDIASIKVNVTNKTGIFVYSFDGGPFQTDSYFYDVESGLHTIRVKDISDKCGETVVSVLVLKYPKFFTPNGDGFNDYWNIKDLKNNSEAVVYIYDRFGKLINSIKPAGEGWDGTFNGRNMPSDDYWFKVEYKVNGESRVFRSNFTLKR